MDHEHKNARVDLFGGSFFYMTLTAEFFLRVPPFFLRELLRRIYMKRTDIKSARKRALKSSFGTLIIKSVWRHV